MLTISTVYLGAQPRPLLFLLIGWGEALIESLRGAARVRIPAYERLLG